ncbi:MAG: DNA recombination protein RmuC [Bacteroidota bacterium]|jgi:DNA recombination protein RmuC|nr:DNA recombination protein RmuC [Ignavibacteria bacterium]MCU7499434.1 DNA recombination protein RmuC [Ignavibacteria bacterium]MCU7512734.1 DNA recombination protein RmuC [Ignavibacteria bacterium]MCU7521837.1 DNA recombination protein RmuC [Ignavibacteria bacterium]MCU7524446.1 DNA recombination protein RmuC [Ignavibacteria bacterium]
MQELLLFIILFMLTVILLLTVRIWKNSAHETSSKLPDELRGMLSEGFSRTEKEIRAEFSSSRSEANNQSVQLRTELNNIFRLLEDSLLKRMVDLSKLQKSQLDIFSGNLVSLSKTVDEKIAALTQTNEKKFEELKEKVQEKLGELQTSNSQKLEEMRLTVDEKLQSTLEKRLGDSFRLVSERLEMVHRGLGEMQSLANGVGDLKRVLSNIKTRGTWGEVQLGSLIEQILSPEQYSKNVATKKNSSCIVEYAVKMPGRGNSPEEALWLPIDAKFPLEDYQRLCEAQDSAETAFVEESAKALENRIKSEARDIKEKYLDPPNTTDFAILFLPVEGLYAEILRRPGLTEKIQNEFRVIVAGPTTLTAILNSLQMGFRTLAIEKRSSEVWNLLGMVKTEFSNFGTILDKTRKKLQEASNTIENASVASRRIERKLKDVQALPASEGLELLIENTED